MATLESFLKLNNYGDYDLSEEHLRWWASDGEYGWSVNDMDGALNYEAMGYLTSWSGPKLEKISHTMVEYLKYKEQKTN